MLFRSLIARMLVTTLLLAHGGPTDPGMPTDPGSQGNGDSSSGNSGGSSTTSTPTEADRAVAYYHYAMASYSARHYAEYTNKAIENLEAAIRADPHTKILTQELSKVGLMRRVPVWVYQLPPPRRTGGTEKYPK
jgi:hypothetical protein